MSYDFVTLDPAAMIERAMATNSMPGSGLCLRFDDECWDTPTSRLRSGSGDPSAPADGNWLDAQDGFWFCRPEFRFPGDALDAPVGADIYYGQMIGGDPAGHIVPVVAPGTVRTTTGTRVITMSIADLNDQRPSIRRDGTSSVLGYTTAHGNNPIAGLTTSPVQEDDMYDTTAQQGLYTKIENEGRPFKAYGWGTGVILLGPGGKQWNFPNRDYFTLCQSLGLCGGVIKTIPDNELDFTKYLLGLLAPDPATDAVDHIVSLDAATVAELAKQIPTATVTITPKDADTIADLVAGKIPPSATKADVIAALKSITVTAG